MRGGGTPLCHFFQQGKCVKGSSCPFVHEMVSHNEETANGDSRTTEGIATTEGVGEAALAASVAKESAPLLAMQGALKATREGPSFHMRGSKSEKTPAAAEEHVHTKGGRGHDRPHQRGGGGGGRHGGIQGGRGRGGRGPDRGGGGGGPCVWGNNIDPPPMAMLPMFGQSLMMSPMGPVQVSMGPNGPSITPITPASFERMMREGGSSQVPMPMNDMAAVTPLMGGGMIMNESPSLEQHHGKNHRGQYDTIISPSIVEAADGGFVTRKKLKKMEGGETGRKSWQQDNNQQPSKQHERDTRGGTAMQKRFNHYDYRHQDKKQEQRRRINQQQGSALLRGSDTTTTENIKPVTFKVRSLDEMNKSTTTREEVQISTKTAPEAAAPVGVVPEVEAGTTPVITTPSISSPVVADLGDDLGNSFLSFTVFEVYILFFLSFF